MPTAKGNTLRTILIVVVLLVAFTLLNLFIIGGRHRTATGGGKRILFYRDAMNPSFTSPKPGKAPDGMDLVPVYEGEDSGSGVRIDPAMVQNTGVRTEKAAVRTITRDIRTSATVVPDERRVYSVTTRVMGFVGKLYASYTGQRVQRGDPLFDLYSPDLIGAEAEYLQAYKFAAGVDTSQLLVSARRRLLNWNISEEQITALEKRGTPDQTITIASPADGTVMEKMIVEGQQIMPGMALYKIVDYSKVWVVMSVYQQDVPLLRVGQKADVELDYNSDQTFTGTVTYIAPELDMDSRTLSARLELANGPDEKVKPGMNATVTVHAALNRSAVTVPEQAVIHTGTRTIVVIAKGGGYFEPREVEVGQIADGYTEVVKGVQDGEEVVVSSQFLIDSESNLRAAVMKMGGSAAPVPSPAETTGMQNMPGMNSGAGHGPEIGTLPGDTSATRSSRRFGDVSPSRLSPFSRGNRVPSRQQKPAAPETSGSMQGMPGMTPEQMQQMPTTKPESTQPAPPDTGGGMKGMPGMPGM